MGAALSRNLWRDERLMSRGRIAIVLSLKCSFAVLEREARIGHGANGRGGTAPILNTREQCADARVRIASAAIVLFLSGMATPASAVPPVRTYTGTFTSFTITGPCSVNKVPFDVLVQALADKEAVTTFY